MQRLILALDNQISNKAAKELVDKGFKVVHHARHEPDDVWIETALNATANVFVSPDIDVPNYLEKIDAKYTHWIDVPQNMDGKQQARYILNRLAILKKELTK